MTQSDISVIIPVYNVAKYLPQCMDSLLAQQGACFEAILIDDGSTDGSGDICEKYAKLDPRVSVIHKENGGVASARNIGMDNARGRFLSFLDPDDYLEPDALRILWNAQQKSGSDFTRGGHRTVFDEEYPKNSLTKIDSPQQPRTWLYYVEEENGLPALHYIGGCWAALLKAELVREHRLRHPEHMVVCSDVLFNLQVARVLKTYKYVDQTVYVYRRQAENSLTSTYSANKSFRSGQAVYALGAVYDYIVEQGTPRIQAETAMGNMYTNRAIRYLVALAADSCNGDEKRAFETFREFCATPLLHRMIRHYDPSTGKGKSVILPWLIRFGMGRTAFYLCRHKAIKRYLRKRNQP